jgi:hypothetical protein
MNLGDLFINIVGGLLATLLIYLGARLAIAHRRDLKSGLVGDWEEISTTIDDDNKVRRHVDQLKLRRVRGTQFFLGTGSRVKPHKYNTTRWRYVGRYNDTSSYMIYWQGDINTPLRCGVVILRRRDDDTWTGVFVRPTQRTDSESQGKVHISGGLMTNPITWSRMLP